MAELPDQIRLSVVLGAVLHNERVARGFTQQQLAVAAGLHPMALSKIERGIQQDIGVETVQRIASALCQDGRNVTASELIAMAERWQYQLYAEWQQGTLPMPQTVPSKTSSAGLAAAGLSGAALAAVLLLLMDRNRK